MCKKLFIGLSLILLFASPFASAGWHNNNKLEFVDFDVDVNKIVVKTTSGSIFTWEFVNDEKSLLRVKIAISELVSALVTGQTVDLWTDSSGDLNAIRIRKPGSSL